jgi:hypothetical protein
VSLRIPLYQYCSKKRRPLLDNGTINTFPRQRINMRQRKNFWTRCFLFGKFWMKAENTALNTARSV